MIAELYVPEANSSDVARATVLGLRDFLTFDARQGKLARKARLRVFPATT